MSAFSTEPEERCGHYVTEQVKKLWAVQLDLLDQLDAICQKHNIRYFAAGGTLLGAVRHQGFIPWDDDMDFFMPDEDYDKFCRVAPLELQAPYHYQDFRNTKSCGPTMVRLRNSNTTGCTHGEYINAVPPHNLGIFIDIFPLYRVPDSDLLWVLQGMRVFAYAMANNGYKQLTKIRNTRKVTFKDNLNPYILAWRLFSLFMDHDRLCEKYLVICKGKGSKVGLTGFLGLRKQYVWDGALFDETVRLPFEDRTVPCPAGYDGVLSHQYGDYRQPVKGAALHTMEHLDPDTPYTETFKEAYAAVSK